MDYEQEQKIVSDSKEYVSQNLALSHIDDNELREKIDNIVNQRIGSLYCSLNQRASMVEQVYSSIRGFGLLDTIISDDSITEVMINGPDNIFIEQNGRLTKLNKRFESTEKLEDIIQRIVGLAGREVNQANPICDTRLPDGSRVNVVLPPIALCGPTITIRKFSKTPMTIEKLISYGSITQEIADKLEVLVKSKYNIFISGGTGSGKTTFLNALSNYIPKDERVITIEDSAELQITGIENLVSLETRNANTSGIGQITIRDLIKSSLRMRPERIVVVYGFFGLVVLVPFIRDNIGGNGTGSILTASILLGIMILPTIITVSESAIRAVPDSYYEGSLGLGATHERTVFRVILPAAKSGILAGIVLGIGRAIGETMAVILVAGNQAIIPDSVLSGVRTLTTNIVMEMGYASGLHREALIATGVVLFVLILLINALLSVVKRRSE